MKRPVYIYTHTHTYTYTHTHTHKDTSITGQTGQRKLGLEKNKKEEGQRQRGRSTTRNCQQIWLPRLTSAFEVTDLLRAIEKAELLFELDCTGIFGDIRWYVMTAVEQLRWPWWSVPNYLITDYKKVRRGAGLDSETGAVVTAGHMEQTNRVCLCYQ